MPTQPTPGECRAIFIGVVAVIGFAAQAKLDQFESAGASALHTFPFSFNSGDARDMNLIGRGVVTTPPFIEPFCMSVGA